MMIMRIPPRLSALAACLIALGCAHAEPTEPATPDAAEPSTAEPSTHQADAAPDAVALLHRAEAAADGLDTLEARLRYDRIQGLLGDRQRRFGRLAYDAGGEDRPARFAVTLDKLLVDGQPRDIAKRYVFDGRWLAEADADDKTFTRRELVAEGESTDLMAMGDGPFALPLNMHADTVLQRFVAEDVTPDDGPPILRLTPREGFDVDVDQVTIVYDPDTMLPREATTVEDQKAGDVSILRLFDPKTGVTLEDADFDTAPPSDPAWRVQVVELEAPAS